MDNIVVLCTNGNQLSVSDYIQSLQSKHDNYTAFDVFNNITHDLWENILMNFNPIELEQLCDGDIKMDDYCKTNNIIEKRKMKGFPRKSGYCADHDVSCYVDDIPDLKKIYGYEYNEVRNMLSTLLDLLYQNNVNLVFGDLIFTKGLNAHNNDGTYIFDGREIIGLDFSISDFGELPSKFMVIINGVPIDYWVTKHKINESSGQFKFGRILIKKGIELNYNVWLNLTNNIREECINNIRVDKNGILMTSFTHNSNIYFIYTLVVLPDQEKFYKHIFKEVLEKDIISLSCKDLYDLLPQDDDNKNKLFK